MFYRIHSRKFLQESVVNIIDLEWDRNHFCGSLWVSSKIQAFMN